MHVETSNSALRHALQNWDRTAAGELLINGMTIRRALVIAGGTPAYLYDRSVLHKHVGMLRSALPKSLKVLYALKANPNPAFVACIANLVDGFDIASGGELGLAFSHAQKNATLQFSGPGKSRDEITRALAADTVLNVESLQQLNMIAEIARTSAFYPKICLRVNPSFLPGGSGLRMTGRPTQFGILSDSIPAAIQHCRHLGMEPMGFHFYWGTQLLDGRMIADIQQRSWAEARTWIAQLDLNISHLNLGGGFGIPYFQNDEALDVVPIAQALRNIGEEYSKLAPGGSLVIELGRYIAGEAGIYVSTIIDIKHAPTDTYLVIDGGMHHHLAASGNLGQGLPRSFPCILPTKLNSSADQVVSVAGCLCTPIDLMARKIRLPKTEPGDLFAILQSGAYGATASPSGFLSHNPPHEQLI